MSFPKYAEVDLALLLELVRAGRPVRPFETYDVVTRHFPQLTDEDKTALRKDGRTRIWINMIHWARDHLRVYGVLDESLRGFWSLTATANQVLTDWLIERGVQDPARFVSSSSGIPDVLGPNWARELRSRRTPKKTKAPIPSHPDAAVGGVPTRQADGSQETVSSLSTLVEENQRATRQMLLEKLRKMDEYEFESLVGRILEALGFRNTVVVGRPGDGGVDVRCELTNRLVTATVAVQVKRQQSNVGPKEISYLRDRWRRRVDKLLFVTTGDYTAGAREVAADPDSVQVNLVSGEQLTDLMIEERIGISTRSVQSLYIDDEFFGS